MRKNQRPVGRARRGANAIEFGLTAPIFFAIILGVMDYGWLFANQAGLDNASALACREGAMMDPIVGDPISIADTEIKARANPWCSSGLGCSYSVTLQQAVPDRTLVCDVQMTFAPLIGFVPLPANISSVSRYRLEWQR